MKINWNFITRRWDGIGVEQVKIWEGLYPDVDVVNVLTVEIPRWLDKKEGKAITRKKDWKKTICNWLKKEQMRAVGII
ncbi:MAG: hypothetical protein PHE11_08010 [Candidatus Omnitrophica bacterium]|nr:hypothetical protein [Candidatus Omnitrophota bacterium]